MKIASGIPKSSIASRATTMVRDTPKDKGIPKGYDGYQNVCGIIINTKIE